MLNDPPSTHRLLVERVFLTFCGVYVLQHVPSIVDHRWIHVYVWEKSGNIQAISFIGAKDGLSTI